MELDEEDPASITVALPQPLTRAARLARREARSKMSTQSRQNSRARSAPRDWLPNTRPQSTFTHKVIRRGNVQAHRDRDWFLNLATGLEPRDSIQSKMCTKFYLFLRDFIPEGLTGRFGHISGEDVMHQLLCHSESTVSRHRVTKHAQVALSELESWMGNCKTWHDALMRAKDNDSNKNKLKRRTAGKAPGLHSPAALLAVLIISHPDPDSRFRNWIGRLEIDWMVTQDRSSLEVQDGFWKGIHSENLDIAFATDASEPRRAEVDLLADYGSLFGKNFQECRKDIRPFLPPELATSLVPLTGHASDVGDGAEVIPMVNGSETGGSRGPAADTIPKLTPEETTRMRQRLNAGDAESDLGRLEEWLIRELLQPGEVLTEWCRHWEARINAAVSYEDQMITRSLFQQQLGRLRELHAASKPLAGALMLVDLAEAAQAEADVSQAVKSALSKLSPFQACQKANDQVLRRVEIEDPSQVHRLERLRARQTASFCYVTGSPYSDHWTALSALEALYASCIAMGHENPVMEAAELQFWQSKRDIALDDKAVTALKLTRWQLLALLLPGSLAKGLTPCQTQIFRRRFCAEGDETPHNIDFSELNAMPVTETTPYPPAIRDRHQSLSKLFGQVRQPDFETAPASPSSSAVASASLSVQSIVPDPAPISVASSTPTSPHDPPPVRNATPANVSSAEEGKRNRFAGKSFTKRGGSPLADARSPKVPRPSGGIVTRRDLSEELQELKKELKGDMEELRLGLTAPEMMEDCKAQLVNLSTSLAAFKDDVTRILNKDAEATTEHRSQLRSEIVKLAARVEDAERKLIDTQAVTDNLEKHRDGLKRLGGLIETHNDNIGGSVTGAMREFLGEITTLVKTQKDAILCEMTAELSKVAGAQKDDIIKLRDTNAAESQSSRGLIQRVVQQNQDILKAVQDLQQQPPPPQPGQDSYLAQCAAPPGWDQKSYECTLLRGAWLYINCLGNPEHGVTEDEAALDVVNTTFPGLREDDIMSALDHVHMQAYGSLFQKE